MSPQEPEESLLAANLFNDKLVSGAICLLRHPKIQNNAQSNLLKL